MNEKLPKQWKHWCADMRLSPHKRHGRRWHGAWTYLQGRGFYWRPRMVVEVKPGGERRFAEISRLLENSGIVMEAAKP